MEWISINERLPEANKEVMTKISDEQGDRNEQTLIFANNLWWMPNKSMYVYYSPTHWHD